MIEFEDFAREHGLLIDRLAADDQIHRCPTQNKPKKANGAYRFNGVWGWIQDHQAHPVPVKFPPDGQEPGKVDPELQRKLESEARARQKSERDTQIERALLARNIVRALSEPGIHPYLAQKGFPDHKGLVDHDGKALLVAAEHTKQRIPDSMKGEDLLIVPVRNRNNYEFIQSIQWISPTGEKTFLRGARMKQGVFRIGSSHDAQWFCEGFATGLSLQAALSAANKKAQVVVCFNAYGMQEAAKASDARHKFIFADHDKVNELTGTRAGEQAAKTAGVPWCQSEVLGDDANDMHQRAGIFEVARMVRDTMNGEGNE